jgi:hypothetical protein
MFASASRVQRSRLRRRCSRSGRSGAIITRTGTFLERREGDNVCEALQCRSLGLSLSSRRRLKRTHTFDRSHRRSCRYQYTRIIIFICVSIFYVIWITTIYYAHGPIHLPWDTDSLLARRELCTVLYLMYHVLWSSSCRPLHQTNHAMFTALAQAVQRVRLG